MKANRIWLDLETTGFDSRMDQILELAAIVDDPDGNEIDRLEIKIKLKHNITPGPGALLVNRINPYSKAWNQEAVTEHEAAKIFADFTKRHTTASGVKPIFTAYNVDFDKEKSALMLVRNGFKWQDHFNRSSIDPLKTARALVQAGKIQTKIKTYAGGRTAPSSSLEDVVAGLGIKYKGDAHRAMVDVEAMRDATKIMFKMATGYELSQIDSDPSKYQPGQTLKIITDSKSSGAKVRHVLILDNDIENGRIVAIDEDDIDKSGGFSKTSVRKFNYGTIVGEFSADPGVSEKLESIATSRQEEVQKLLRDAKNQLKKDEQEEFTFDSETQDFSLIEKIQKSMATAKDRKAVYAMLLKELTSRLGKASNAKALLLKAEDLGCAKGLEKWDIEPIREDIRIMTTQAPGVELRVGLHPAGHYAIGLVYDKNGRKAKELKESKTKKDIASFLKSRINKNPQIDEFVESELPEIGDFKNPKHAVVIEAELRNTLDALTVKEVSEDTKAGIAGLILQLQAQYPNTFAKYKLPIDPSSHNVFNYWKKRTGDDGGRDGNDGDGNTGGQDSGSGNFTPDGGGGFAAASGQEPDLTAFDHIKPGEKISKTPCALCGRPLSDTISIRNSMGPTCRKNAQIVEQSEGPLDDFTDTYRSFTAIPTPKPGDLLAVKIGTPGISKEILAEFVSSDKNISYVIDRRKVMRLLKNGVAPFYATYLSMSKLPHSSISSVAKLKASKDKSDHK